MSDQQQPEPGAEFDSKPQGVPYYLTGSKMEAHIIADMLRIESIATEMREHKNDFGGFRKDVNKRFDKLENWIIAIVAISTTSLISILGSLLIGALSG
jgi:hypothetical protein